MTLVDAAPAQESVGARVRRLRLERKLTQRDVAGPGCSYAYISRIEAGARTPSHKALVTLARNLGVSVEYLETGEPVPGVYDREIRLSDAELALRLGKDEQPLAETFRALLAEAREAADDTGVIRARVGLGLALAREGEYREAMAHLEKATAARTVTPSARPDVYYTLGRCYASIGEGQRSVRLFEDALAQIPPDDLALQVRFGSYLGCALTDWGDRTRAREVLMDLTARAGDSLDARGRVFIYWTMARTEKMDGEPLAAMTLMRRALGLLEASEDALGVARAHLTCAEILLLEGDADVVTPHLERADKLFELGADSDDLGALRTAQALCAVLLGDADEAQTLAREALAYLTENAIDQGSAWRALGGAQALAGEIDAACESFQKAVELLGHSGEWREGVAAYREWAHALRSVGRESEAFEAMERGAILKLKHMGRSRVA